MKVLGISGSPRKDSTTEKLVQEVVAAENSSSLVVKDLR